MTIEQLQQPILTEFEQFREEYRRRTISDVPLLSEVEDYLGKIPGKQLRPILVLLSAKACGEITHNHVMLATAIELLHNASLMHDDVVDESNSRRGCDSIRHRWSNQVAVLCGDYYLSRVMSVLHDVKHRTAAKIINRIVSIMCEGELKQLANIGNKQLKVDTYIDIIGGKTASLMSACCELGSCSFSDEGDTDYFQALSTYSQAMRDFGYHYGIVYQIRDDINDIANCHDIGFPKNADPQQLINNHIEQAMQALNVLPDSHARQLLADLLLPTAPQPV